MLVYAGMHCPPQSWALNIYQHCWTWLSEQHFGEKDCCCGISSVPAKLRFPLPEGPAPWQELGFFHLGLCPECSWAPPGRHPSRSWPPTSLPAAHTHFPLWNHQMWDASAQERNEWRWPGSWVLSLPLSTWCQDSCIQSKPALFF